MEPKRKSPEEEGEELPLNTRVQGKLTPIVEPKTDRLLFEWSQVTMEASYAGPLPHPVLLRQFNEMIPNGADRIMKVFEGQSYHRIKIEASGPPLALFALALILGAGCFVAYLGDTKTGGGVIIFTLVGIVSLFVTGKYLGQGKNS